MKKISKKKNTPMSFSALVVLVIVMLIAFCLSAFVSSDVVTNRFKVSTLKIALLEENYDQLTEQQRSKVIPNLVLAKDPKVKNTDKTDAFIFLKVTVPVDEVTDVEADGTKTTKQPQEVFWLKTEAYKNQNYRNTYFNTDTGGNNEYWVELTEYESGTDLTGKTRTYVFGYSVYMKPGEITETLFDYVQLKNIVQHELNPYASLHILVDAYGIQADYLEGIQKNNGNEKAVMTAEQLKTIYGNINNAG